MRFRSEPEITLKNNYILVEVKVIGIQGKKEICESDTWFLPGPGLAKFVSGVNSREVGSFRPFFQSQTWDKRDIIIPWVKNAPRGGLLAPK